MTRAELEHAIRAACDVADDSELIVFGSQAILGQYPNAHPSLRMSAEADVMPKNHPERVDDIDGALGEYSSFHETFGFYVHGVSIEAATLAPGWEQRCIKVRNANTRLKTGLCLEAHDLAAAKIAAFRDKDKEFVRILLREGLVEPTRLLSMVEQLPIEQRRREVLITWITHTARELAPIQNES